LNKLYALILFAVAILVIACGGGGGGGGGGTSATSGNTSSTSGGGGLTRIRIEAVVASQPTRPIDPRHIMVGEDIQFQLVGYTAAGARNVIAASGFTTNDATLESGPLLPNGSFDANAPSSQDYTVSVTSGSNTYTKTYRVVPVRAIVAGTLLDSNTVPVELVDVIFLDAANNIVERVRTAFDGFFRASVPTNAVKFNLDPATVSTTKYYQSFRHNSLRFTTLDPDNCSPSLPALNTGVLSHIGTVRLDARLAPGGGLNTPPPPPDGC
jgi:hypothetical protein